MRGSLLCKGVFAKFNTEGHPLHRGHSLSVSDVVLTEKGAFFCDKVGFKEIAFDETLAHKPDDLLKIVYVESNRLPFISEIGNDLKSLQRAVLGHIEPVYMGDGTIIEYTVIAKEHLEDRTHCYPGEEIGEKHHRLAYFPHSLAADFIHHYGNRHGK